MSDALLPPEFAELEPWAATWCLATEPERITSGCFQTSTAYDTMSSECRSWSSRSASGGRSSSGNRSQYVIAWPARGKKAL